jgi:hypothetical protein
VPSIYKFKPEAGNASAAFAQMLAAKNSKVDPPIQAIFMSMDDLDFTAGAHRPPTDDHIAAVYFVCTAI